MEVEDAEDYGALDGGGRVPALAAGCEVLYLRTLLDRLGEEAPPIYEDNTACIKWGNNVIGGRKRAKHIDIKKHFAHEVIQNGAMRLIKVPIAQQIADILTKGLHLPQFLAWALGTEVGTKHLRDLCPQEGVWRVVRQGDQFESSRGVFRRLIGSQGPS